MVGVADVQSLNRQAHIDTNQQTQHMHPECNCYSCHTCLQFRIRFNRSRPQPWGQARRVWRAAQHQELWLADVYAWASSIAIMVFHVACRAFYVYVFDQPFLFGMPAHIMLRIAGKCLEFISSGQITYLANLPPAPPPLLSS